MKKENGYMDYNKNDFDSQELFDEDFYGQMEELEEDDDKKYDDFSDFLPDEEDTSFEEKFDAENYNDHVKLSVELPVDNEYYDHFNGTYGFKIRLKQNKKPTLAQLQDIMNNYHSGDNELKNTAITQMMEILDAYIHGLIKEQYPTYEQKYSEDLISYAYMGIMQGMDNYDPLRGTPTTWFSRFIKHSLQTFINQMVNHSTSHYTNANKKIAAVIQRKEQEGKPWTSKDICLETGLSIKTVQKVLNTKIANNALPFESKSSITESIQSSAPDPEKTAIDNDTREYLFNIMKSSLSDEEQLCILHYYGFDTGEPETPQEIANKTGIPKQNIRKIINSALAKMEKPIRAANTKKRKNIIKPSKIGVNTINRSEMHQMIDELYDSLDNNY